MSANNGLAALGVRWKAIAYAVLALVAFLILKSVWPFYSVPTGFRGVVTTFGKITGIEGEGLAVLPP